MEIPTHHRDRFDTIDEQWIAAKCSIGRFDLR
jgi:hypothetical protein